MDKKTYNAIDVVDIFDILKKTSEGAHKNIFNQFTSPILKNLQAIIKIF